MNFSMRTEKLLPAVTSGKRVTGYKPPTEAHAEKSTSCNDSLPEEYGEMKYGIPSSLTLDPEGDKVTASTTPDEIGPRNRDKNRDSIRGKPPSNEMRAMVTPNKSKSSDCKVPNAVFMHSLLLPAPTLLNVDIAHGVLINWRRSVTIKVSPHWPQTGKMPSLQSFR
jgi:hypothetical protein